MSINKWLPPRQNKPLNDYNCISFTDYTEEVNLLFS